MESYPLHYSAALLAKNPDEEIFNLLDKQMEKSTASIKLLLLTFYRRLSKLCQKAPVLATVSISIFKT